MSESTMKLVRRFTKSPTTPEKNRICKLYLDNEIETLDFVLMARKYMDTISDIKSCITMLSKDTKDE